ncbi:hypothetical protein JIX56_41995 [Streptomyces sp. CA-210063]|uniref:hypothetical protein n=1 Tax=Streptomyces sp. CA-210063 TaxID=2801029 RepID=UPI00214CB85D|nr:hypothetical protein [Streptomyces sp. CA-210063]UUU35887.1 hypothetical protein JIX56_41995 [Streptomyces sp. CA-210063]
MSRKRSDADRPARLLFEGWIAGMGTSSGTRIVLGHWERSPFGPFSDVMIELANGQRVLLAPTGETADFIAGVYVFDTVRVVPVDVSLGAGTWTVRAGSLDLRFSTGRRGPLGLGLRVVPGALARRPAWATLTDFPARLLLTGVRTRGSAGSGRREWYGARDLRPIRAVAATFEGDDLGALTPVDPPVRFGFGSVPRKPAVTRVVTTVARTGRSRRTSRPPPDRPPCAGARPYWPCACPP